MVFSANRTFWCWVYSHSTFCCGRGTICTGRAGAEGPCPHHMVRGMVSRLSALCHRITRWNSEAVAGHKHRQRYGHDLPLRLLFLPGMQMRYSIETTKFAHCPSVTGPAGFCRHHISVSSFEACMRCQNSRCWFPVLKLQSAWQAVLPALFNSMPIHVPLIRLQRTHG